MKYVSLIHALNIPCDLETSGDWHSSSIQWSNPNILDTEDSIFGEYGIEENKMIPEHKEKFAIANHIRALLDLLYIGNFTVAQGMNKDFICNSKYDMEIFNKVITMINLPHWEKIDKFMIKEYLGKWVKFKEGVLTNE